jgi:signal transduction histidine kinase
VADLTTAQHELVRSEKLASLGSMVAGISHELNTPIGNTVTVASTLQSQAKDFSKLVEGGKLRRTDLTDFLATLQDMADIISRSTTRASELISSFKQVAVDRSSERRREFDLQSLVNDIVTSLKPTLRGTRVEFDVQVPGGVMCDSFPGPVGQVLTNLVQNAVTHAFAETGKGRIAISAHDDGDKVVLRVADNGVGMTEHTLNHAFDPFFTTRLGKGGSGLGLSVSYSIATSILRGDLSATSTPGQGSVFTLSFLRTLPKDA